MSETTIGPEPVEESAGGALPSAVAVLDGAWTGCCSADPCSTMVPVVRRLLDHQIRR
ncbi:hypothetical protein [Streptomyces sp. JNUCC 63]